MSEPLSILVKPIDNSLGRRIYIRSQRGETYWTLEEAIELLMQLTPAIERGIDPTPLPKPERTYAAPLPNVKASPSPSDIGDLL